MRECTNDKPGTIYADWKHGNYRCIIMRGPCALCGYIGVKSDHPAFGKDYSDIDVSCHGGLTFSQEGKDEGNWPSGWWWFGWDYGHSGDASFYDFDERYSHYRYSFSGSIIEWSPQNVYNEFEEVIGEFEKLLAGFVI